MSEPQLPREVKRWLAIIRHAEEVTGNVALTCRYYGISRQCYQHGMCPRLEYLRSTKTIASDGHYLCRRSSRYLCRLWTLWWRSFG